jgi:hypothetical protein
MRTSKILPVGTKQQLNHKKETLQYVSKMCNRTAK